MQILVAVCCYENRQQIPINFSSCGNFGRRNLEDNDVSLYTIYFLFLGFTYKTENCTTQCVCGEGCKEVQPCNTEREFCEKGPDGFYRCLENMKVSYQIDLCQNEKAIYLTENVTVLFCHSSKCQLRLTP